MCSGPNWELSSQIHGAYLVLTLCGLALRSTRMTRPRVQRTIVHEETHPCGSNFIQSVFKTVQTRCIDSVLIQIVPFVNNTI